MRQGRSFLWGIVGTGLMVRLIMVCWVPTRPVSDFWLYLEDALRLFRGGGYANSQHPIGYSLFLAASFFVLPVKDHLLAAKLDNAVFGGLAALAGTLLAWEVWEERAAAAVGILLALYPRSILTACLLASENLFAPLLLLFLLVQARAWRRERAWAGAAVGGAVLALLTMTRPIGYLLGALWPFSALASGKRWRAAAMETLLMVSVQHLAMLPWAMINYKEFGHFSFLSAEGGSVLFVGNNSNSTGVFYPWVADFKRAAPEASADMNPYEIDRLAYRSALRWIRAHPGDAWRLYRKKLRLMFTNWGYPACYAISAQGLSPPFPPTDVLPEDHLLKRRLNLVEGAVEAGCKLVLTLGFLGLLWLSAQAMRSPDPTRLRALVLLLGTASYLTFVTAVFTGEERFRWPIEDVMTLPAGWLLARVWSGAAAIAREARAGGIFSIICAPDAPWRKTATDR